MIDNFHLNLFKGKRAFVLGGSGLIGKEVIKLLLKRGCQTINLDIKKNKIFSNYEFLNEKFSFAKFNCQS